MANIGGVLRLTNRRKQQRLPYNNKPFRSSDLRPNRNRPCSPRVRPLAAQPSEQRRKLAAVLLGYCSKLQPQTAARHDVPDHSISANLPFTHQEIDLRRRADSPERGSL